MEELIKELVDKYGVYVEDNTLYVMRKIDINDFILLREYYTKVYNVKDIIVDGYEETMWLKG